ncbi:MAG: hypothetical protein WAR79_04985 [Melioribacteraceae bacterium]
MKKINSTLFLIFLINSLINSQVFETERGKIEVLGLKKWDAQKLIDSMKALNPNKPIHACAAEMKYNFGFIEVSALTYIEDFSDLSSMYTIVTIIEDNESSKVKYLSKPNDSLAILKEYKICDSLIKSNQMLYFVGLQMYYLVKEGNLDSAKHQLDNYGIEFEKVKPFWDYLLSKNNIEDMNLALWVLKNDSNISNRIIALSILLNFGNYDAVWWALMDLQRYEDQQLSIPTIEILRAFNSSPRKIDWTPAINSIKYILNGTNLFAFQGTLELLTSTEISPDLSKCLLENSSELIQTFLNAQHAKTREIAIKFIKQISGNNEITTAEDCKVWLNSL